MGSIDRQLVESYHEYVKLYSKSLLSREKATDTFLIDVHSTVRDTIQSIGKDLEDLRNFNVAGDAPRFLKHFRELRRTLDFYSKSRKRDDDAAFVESVKELLAEFDFIEARWGVLAEVKEPLGDAVAKLWKGLSANISPPDGRLFNSQLDTIFSEMRRELTPIWGAHTVEEIKFAHLLKLIGELDELVSRYGDTLHRQALEDFHRAFDPIEARLMVLEVVDA